MPTERYRFPPDTMEGQDAALLENIHAKAEREHATRWTRRLDVACFFYVMLFAYIGAASEGMLWVALMNVPLLRFLIRTSGEV